MRSSLLRRIIYLVLTIAFIWYGLTHKEEIRELLHAFSQGSWLWLIVAALIQVAFFAVVILMTKFAFRVVDMKRKFLELLPLVFGSIFVNVLAPTAGQSGAILYADDAAKRNESTPKAIIGNLISTISGYVAFSFILFFALIYLRSYGLLNDFEVAGAMIFVLWTVLPGILIFTAYKSQKFTVKILDFLYFLYRKILKIIRKKKRYDKEWSTKIASELFEAAESIIKNKLDLIGTLLLGFIAHAINILCLYVIFEAFAMEIYFGALIAGYAVGEMVRVISPHPEGVGVTEAAMAVLFASFGVPLISATAISLIFRAYNFWIPLGFGFVLLRRLRSFSN